MTSAQPRITRAAARITRILRCCRWLAAVLVLAAALGYLAWWALAVSTLNGGR